MKVKLKAFLDGAHQGLDELNEGLEKIEQQLKEVAEYFCEDPKNLRLRSF